MTAPDQEEPAQPRILIGLIGKKRSGKDTVAATLTREYGFVRYAFADPLKATILAVDPFIEERVRLAWLIERVGWERAKDIYPEVRRLLQAHGLSMREEVDQDIWLRATMTKVAAEAKSVVITDVRFPNEADAIRSAGGVLVRITRPALTSSDTHVSETALDAYACDHLIANEGGLAELRSAVVDLAGRLLGWWD